MGTPRFAVSSLEKLIRNGFPVLAVVTAPDKASGRGMKMREPEVKIAAARYNIPVLQPPNLKDDKFAGDLRSLSADIFVVVAFRMLPEKIWSIPPVGTINLHASVLPYYRGAAPINHAIMNGERVTGVTTFFIEKDIDTGKVLLQKKIEIGEKETAGELHDRLMKTGADLLIETVDKISKGSIEPVSQESLVSEGDIPVAPKISRNDCRINWMTEAGRVHDFVRGLSPWPGAWTVMVRGEREILLKVLLVDKAPAGGFIEPGRMIAIGDEPAVGVSGGAVLLKLVKPEGKREMTGAEFLRGFRPGENVFCK